MMGIWSRYRPIVVILLLSAFLGILTGCDRYSRYRVLSFFLDGVPHPDEPRQKEGVAAPQVAKADQPKKDALPAETPRYSHPPPDGKNDCAACHGPVNRPVFPAKDMCLKCHVHVTAKRPFIHGPAVVDCIVCHNVHESQAKTLVRKVGNPLCFNCHDEERIQRGKAHRDAKEGEFLCLSCHDPHGGKDRFFLK